MRRELFDPAAIYGSTSEYSVTLVHGSRVVKDKSKMNEMSVPRARRTEDGLGPNSDIGAKLRAFYGAVQDQPIPDKFLDLLEKLDEVEQASKRRS
jgi:hypothetical protein